MNIETRAQALALQRLLGRAQQAGLVIDIGCLSRNHRRAALALGRLDTERQVIARHPIGFRYPNSRQGTTAREMDRCHPTWAPAFGADCSLSWTNGSGRWPSGRQRDLVGGWRQGTGNPSGASPGHLPLTTVGGKCVAGAEEGV